MKFLNIVEGKVGEGNRDIIGLGRYLIKTCCSQLAKNRLKNVQLFLLLLASHRKVMPYESFILCRSTISFIFILKISWSLTWPFEFVKQIYCFWCIKVQKKQIPFALPACSIIPLFFLKWLNHIFLPLNLVSFPLHQLGPQFLANLKTCQGCVKERSFSEKCNASHIKLEETPSIFRQVKQILLSVSIIKVRGSYCAIRLSSVCKADINILTKYSVRKNQRWLCS